MGPQPKLDEHRENIIAAIQAAPSLTLDELRAKLDLPGCRTTLWKTLDRGGQSLKRKVMFAAEQWRPDVQSKRRWWDIVVRGCCDRSQLRFIDETAITTHMGRREGRGPRGERVIAHEALGAWKTHTLLAAIRSSGWSAAMVL